MKCIRWLGFSVGLLAASGCGQDPVSPILTLQELPGRHLSMIASRGSTGYGDIGVQVTVLVIYDMSGAFCGTLRSPVATLGGVKLTLVSAGLKTVDNEGMGCTFPTFQIQFGSDAPPGPLEVTDGITTVRAEYDVLDPGTATLLAPLDGTLHPGQSARWHMNLPANHGLSSYHVYATSTVQDWAQGTATPPGGDVVAPIPASFPPSYSGSAGELTLLWRLDAHVIACSTGFICDVRVDALTGFALTIRP
jgi:hypothetical protein